MPDYVFLLIEDYISSRRSTIQKNSAKVHKVQTKAYRQNPFFKEKLSYDVLTDSYGCTNNQLLVFKGKLQQTHKRTGYKSEVRIYECNCSAVLFIHSAVNLLKAEPKNRDKRKTGSI
jgi:hypothetical protein